MLQQLTTGEIVVAGPRVRALVVAPTRELAVQIDESFATYGKYLGPPPRLGLGGVGKGNQVKALSRGVDISPPPRAGFSISSAALRALNRVQYVVLDEADRMLDMGFIHDMRKIIALLPKQRRTLLSPRPCRK